MGALLMPSSSKAKVSLRMPMGKRSSQRGLPLRAKTIFRKFIWRGRGTEGVTQKALHGIYDPSNSESYEL